MLVLVKLCACLNSRGVLSNVTVYVPFMRLLGKVSSITAVVGLVPMPFVVNCMDLLA